MVTLRNCRIGVLGLGYVGLPLAVEFGKHYETLGFDVKPAARGAAARRARYHARGHTRGAQERAAPGLHH